MWTRARTIQNFLSQNGIARNQSMTFTVDSSVTQISLVGFNKSQRNDHVFYALVIDKASLLNFKKSTLVVRFSMVLILDRLSLAP